MSTFQSNDSIKNSFDGYFIFNEIIYTASLTAFSNISIRRVSRAIPIA
jgi:hypothetical protein